MSLSGIGRKDSRSVLWSTSSLFPHLSIPEGGISPPFPGLGTPLFQLPEPWAWIFQVRTQDEDFLLTFSPQSTCQQICITCGPLRNCLQSTRGSKVACTSLVPCDPIEPGKQAKQRLPSLLASPFLSFDHHSSLSYPSRPVMHRFRQEIVREEIIWPLISKKSRNVRFESQDTSHSALP